MPVTAPDRQHDAFIDCREEVIEQGMNEKQPHAQPVMPVRDGASVDLLKVGPEPPVDLLPERFRKGAVLCLITPLRIEDQELFPDHIIMHPLKILPADLFKETVPLVIGRDLLGQDALPLASVHDAAAAVLGVCI